MLIIFNTIIQTDFLIKCVSKVKNNQISMKPKYQNQFWRRLHNYILHWREKKNLTHARNLDKDKSIEPTRNSDYAKDLSPLFVICFGWTRIGYLNPVAVSMHGGRNWKVSLCDNHVLDYVSKPSQSFIIHVVEIDEYSRWTLWKH